MLGKGTVSFRSIVLVAVAATVALGALHLVDVSETANQFAETGRSAIQFLDQYKEKIAQRDTTSVLEFYTEDAGTVEVFGELQELPELSRDTVRVFAWDAQGTKKPDRQLQDYIESLSAIHSVKFKLGAIEQISDPNSVRIRSVLWVRGATTENEAHESFAHYRMALRGSPGSWKIEHQELIHGRTVTGARQGFSDITEQAGIDFTASFNPLFFEPEWKPKKFGIIKYGAAGVSAADYDNDGWYDIFFADGERPRLYRNNGGGSFSDVTERVGLPQEMFGINVAIFADFDNDGDKDLFLGCFTSENRLFRNNGDGTFTDVTEGAGLGGYFVTVAAAADYDNDGSLDLYVGRYLDPRKDLPTTLFYTRNSQGNSLLRNLGDLRFEDVTEKAGVREGGLTLGVAWGDYDEDGDQDLYVANDFGRNALLRNNSDGTFADVSKETGTLDHGFGMSATFGDIDNDLDLDIYVSNVHSSQRWYGHAPTLHNYLLTSVLQGTLIEDFPVYAEIYGQVGTFWHSFGAKMVKGNSLLVNDGQGRFTDISETTGTNPFGWYWSSTFFDYDNDGRQDIYATNGWITGKTKHDL